MRRLPLGPLIGLLLWAAPLPLSAGQTPASGEPYRLSAESPVPDDVRGQLEFLGHRFDEPRGLILDAEQRPLSLSAYRDLQLAYDFRRTPLSSEHRMGFVGMGFRFDEPNGLVLNPFTTKPLSRLEARYLIEALRYWNGQSVLERMRHLLSKQDPGRPIPSDVRRQLSALKGVESQALPPALLRALRPGRPASEAIRAADEAFTEARKLFDGATPLEDLRKAAEPHVPGRNDPRVVMGLRGWDDSRAPPVYMHQEERALGEALQRQAQAHLARNPVGAEVLERFRGQDGRISLPSFQIQRLDAATGAAYFSEHDRIIINHDWVVQGVLASSPEAGRERLARRLADPAPLTRYLAEHPRALERFTDLHDVLLVHELQHAVQARRNRLDIEMRRDNVPPVNPLEGEHEAFIAQSRYLHHKLRANPASVLDNPYLDQYLQFVADLDQFRDGITQSYLQSTPHGAATLPTARELQQTRESIARRLLGERVGGLVDEANELVQRQALRLRGIALGNAELESAQSDYVRRHAEFVTEEYPRLRTEGYDAVRGLAAAFSGAGRPEAALAVAGTQISLARDAAQRAQARNERRRAALAAQALLRSNAVLDYNRWFVLVPALEQYARDTGRPAPPELATTKRSIYTQYVQAMLQSARSERAAAQRAAILEAARGVAEQLGDAALKRQVQAAVRRRR